MKKKVILFLFIFLGISSIVFAQRVILDTTVVRLRYEFSISQDSLKPEAVTTSTMLLQIGKKVSKYWDLKKALTDS